MEKDCRTSTEELLAALKQKLQIMKETLEALTEEVSKFKKEKLSTT